MKSPIKLKNKQFSSIKQLKLELQTAKKEAIQIAKSLRQFKLFALLPVTDVQSTIDVKAATITLVLMWQSKAPKPKDLMVQIQKYVESLGFKKSLKDLAYSKSVGQMTLGISHSLNKIQVFVVHEFSISQLLSDQEIQKVVATKLLKLLGL